MGPILTKKTAGFSNKNSSENTFKIIRNKLEFYQPSMNSLLSFIHLVYQKSNITKLYMAKNDQDNIITETDLRILRLVWKIVKNDIEKVGVMMFMKSFESLPELKESFSNFRDMSIQDLSKSHVLRTHSKKVMRIVENFIIENGHGQIISQLIELGKEHHSFGVTNEFLYIMEKQFIDSIMPIVEKYTIRKAFDEFDFIDGMSNSDLNPLAKELENELKNTDDEMKLNYIRSLFRKVFSSIKHYMSIGLDEAACKKEF